MSFIFILNKHFKDINPTECGEEFCATNFRAGPTSRQYYLIHFIFSGKGTFHTSNTQYTVTKGQAFIIHPFEVVHYFADPGDPWHYCWVGFELSFDSPTINKNSILDIPQAEHIFHAIKGSGHLEQKELYICGKIYELLSIIERPETTKKSKADEHIKKAKQYIDINYMHSISVEQIADNLNINRSYFSTIFKKYIGRSPQQYLVDVRLDNAANLITNHGYSISAAAVSSGYTDVFNFSKMFKHKFGISPAIYAKKRKS